MLVYPTTAAIKIMSRAARYSRGVHNDMPNMIVGREKTMIKTAAAELEVEFYDKYPALEL